MYEEHEDGSFTLHMCEWYEQGRRLVGEYETLGDGSGFAVTDEWPAGLVVPEFLRTLVFARPRGDDQFADCTFSPSLDMSR